MKLAEPQMQDLVRRVSRLVGVEVTTFEQAWQRCPRGDWLAFVALVAADDLRPVIGAALRHLVATLPAIVAEDRPGAAIAARFVELAAAWAAGRDVLVASQSLGFDAARRSSEAILDGRPAVGAATDAINMVCALVEALHEEPDDRHQQIGRVLELLTAATTAQAYHRGAVDEGPDGPDRRPELQQLADHVRAELPAPPTS